VDGIVIGSLSPGVAEDVARSLVRRWPDLPIISPAPWQGDIAAPSLAAIPA
jgi:exonuclease VII large subunit